MRFAAFALFALVLLALVAPAQEPTKNELLVAIEKQLKAAHETAGPCVGCVVVSRSDQYPKAASAGDTPGKLGGFDPRLFLKDNPKAKPELALSLDLSDPKNIPDHGFACGVVIDDKGLVLTPYHVIDGATKIYVHLPGRVGSYADIHAADARNDLAVLKLITPPPGVKAIKFADVRLDNRGGEKATVYSGKLTVLMANSYASNFPLNKPSAALGSISNVHHHLDIPGGDKLKPLDSYYYHGPFLAHDAKLNTGISGAALLNLDGELIGLTTTAPILGGGEKAPDYAFPMDENLRRVIDVLRRGEEVEYGFLGVTLNNGLREVMIRDVIPLGPAAQAGVVGGDVITHINGVSVKSYSELLVHIGSALAGSKVKLTVTRRNQANDVVVTLGKLRHDQQLIASVRPDPVFGLRVDHESILAQMVGSNLQVLTKGVPAGVSVREVAPNSAAATAFKKLGDNPNRWLIISVNGKAVSNPTEFYAAAKDQKSVKLVVIDPTEATRPEREVTFP